MQKWLLMGSRQAPQRVPRFMLNNNNNNNNNNIHRPKPSDSSCRARQLLVLATVPGAEMSLHCFAQVFQHLLWYSAISPQLVITICTCSSDRDDMGHATVSVARRPRDLWAV
ncbi:unnamed protein product [Polarella glacialis]|uniref:Uncharacterized protein n=1 Tax=Polarella glacialis TaxID=89957 RepID=A0A813DD40_POLGL|nr:unnamed protein product [Polarella glacialis]